MSCWKTINLVKDYGGMRIVLTAVSLMILFFIPEYLAMQLIHPQTVQRGDHALLFAGLLVAAIIAHKILHILPMISKKKLEKKIYWLKMRTWREIPKNMMLVSLSALFWSSRLFCFTRGRRCRALLTISASSQAFISAIVCLIFCLPGN